MKGSQSLGQLAYETYVEVMRETTLGHVYPAWDACHPMIQRAHQRAAEAVWVAAFQAGADSAVPAELKE